MLNLLELILEEESTVFSLMSLAKELKCDVRVIIRTVNDLSCFKLDQDGFELFIIKDQLKAIFSDSFSINRIRQQLLRESLLFLLCKDLLEGNFTTVLEFSLDHYVSTSTMYRRLAKLKDYLSIYQLELNLSSVNYFKGEEKQIRHFFYELYFLAYGFDEMDSRKSELELIELSQFSKDVLTEIPYPLLKKITVFSMVSLLRWRGNYLLKEEIPRVNYYEIQLSSQQLSAYFDLLQVQFRLELAEPHQSYERDFFLAYLMTIDILSIDKFEVINFEEVLSLPQESNIPTQWIKEFCYFFEIEISASAYFFMLVNLSYYYFRLELLPNSYRTSLAGQKDYLGLAKGDDYIFGRAVAFTEYLKQFKKFPRLAKTSYFYYLLIRDVLFNSDKGIEICVFSSLSHSQKVNIERQVENLSPVPIKFNERISSKVDLVISDCYFESNKTTIFTGVFPSESDYLLIKNKILDIYAQVS